jgi:hypothetical protein
LEDATEKREATIDRVVIMQMTWLESLSGKAMKLMRYATAMSDGLLTSVPGTWKRTKAEE